jgi:hypothetical protein
MSQFSISTKNRYDVLSNPADYSWIGDEHSLETDQVRLTKKLKCHDIETLGRTSKFAVLDHLGKRITSK